MGGAGRHNQGGGRQGGGKWGRGQQGGGNQGGGKMGGGNQGGGQKGVNSVMELAHAKAGRDVDQFMTDLLDSHPQLFGVG